MAAKDESHTFRQIRREQGVDVVVEGRVGDGGQAYFLGFPPPRRGDDYTILYTLA